MLEIPTELKKRRIEIAVISDVHLGTSRCHAEELLAYLSSIRPKKLILNGDIIDGWEFDKRFFPPAHFRVIKKVFSMAANGTEVYYICGNHDEMLRKFNNHSMGHFHIRNKLLLNLDGKKAWIFHGDVFDLSLQNTKWIARLGNRGYSILLKLNRVVNRWISKNGKPKISLASQIAQSPKANQYIADFKKTVTDLAIRNTYDYVVCGHIHHPGKEWFETDAGSCVYLNSGDWVGNLTALEYHFKRWKIYRYNEDKLSPFFADEDLKEMDINDLISNIVDPTPEEGVPKKEKEKPSGQ